MTDAPRNVLWSAREAAQKLGFASRTVQRIAKERYDAGDPGIFNVSKSFVATPEWWKDALRRTKGRRRTRYDPRTGERLPPGAEPEIDLDGLPEQE